MDAVRSSNGDEEWWGVQKSIASRRRRETVLVFRANTQWNLIETDFFFAPNQNEVCCVYWVTNYLQNHGDNRRDVRLPS